MAQRQPKADKEKQKKDYLAILELFKKLLQSIAEDADQWEVLEELMALRAEIAIQYALDGFGISFDQAMELIEEYDEELSEEEKEEKKIILAAIDNLVDFSVAAEYQMSTELFDFEYDDWGEFEQSDIFSELESICRKYNRRYANIENLDIEYAMMVAVGLLKVRPETTLMYMTQGDERVRPWHLQYEGFTAPKSQFPAWLIPPIENACRCYLVEDTASASISMVSNKRTKKPKMPDWFNPVFKESIALGGRIFSDDHPYFTIDKEHKSKLKKIASRIKTKYLANVGG